MIWNISFSNFSNGLAASACERAISNLWSIRLEVNVLRHVTKSGGLPLPFYWLLKSR